MRSTTFIFLLFTCLGAYSEEFTVFEKEGYFGIKDATGQVTVPAVYEKLGWSSGSNDVFDGVIGYKRGSKWGLITVRNKFLTEQKFYSLEPFSEGYIKGSIKGKFSNHLFYGLLDIKGKTIVSFNYFELDQFNDFLLASSFSNGKQSFGIISMENDILIPLEYQKITSEKNFHFAYTFNHTIDVYHNQSLVQSSLDSVRFNNGIIGHRAGYAGHISIDGSITQNFNFKTIKFENGSSKGIHFPTWQVYQNQELQFEQQCDSIQKTENKIWISYLNGAQHLVLPNADSFDSKDYLIKKIEHDFAIVQHSKTRKFSILNVEGKFLISGYDSIAFSETHFLGLKNNKWDIFNSSGTKLHRISFSKVLPGPKNFFIVVKNDHWGVVDFNGDNFIIFKYDSIIHKSNHYEVKYLNKWGAMDIYGNWMVEPEFNDIQSFGEVIIARRGLGYSIFYNNQFKLKTTYQPVHYFNEHVVIQNDSCKLGLLNQYGEMIIEPGYDAIEAHDEFFELKKEAFSKLVTQGGKPIINEEDGVEDIGHFSESYFSIKKNGRWGFIDQTGKLRISNRYDSVHIFHEDLAAIKLRNKWGFIDKDEKLVIQPYYDQISSFKNELAIVTSNNLSGLINKNGEVLVELSFKTIERLWNDNYKIKDQSDRYGLVSASGKFIIDLYMNFLRIHSKELLLCKMGIGV